MLNKTPIFFLKTKSTPGDAYEEQFSHATNGFDFDPAFVPVLEHRFMDAGMAKVRAILKSNSISRAEGCPYGGLVFTSQRAVEAFSALIREHGDRQWPALRDIPVYSVGPATTRALKAISLGGEERLNVFGDHTGNGEDLAQFILQHYGEWYKDRPTKPTLLFPVGEVHRDAIPRTLGAASYPLDEVVIYGTGVMQSFRENFERLLDETSDCRARWVVVFSPTGCDSMLRALGLLDQGTGAKTGTSKPQDALRKTYIATIGPTTRDHLVNGFGYHPDVCAEQPSPEGVWNGIASFKVPSG
ncbi:tetrapyrrole biosynthesis, uroporphyrinogen III synthase [Podospora conica]|nr:tetrapyrrole biosynthesis, uroporphyrinogen III synthase [Schizothecium conicum]